MPASSWLPVLRHKAHRQLREGSYTKAFAPIDWSLPIGEVNVGKSLKYALERDRGLRPSKLEAKAEMHARAKGKLWIGMAPNVEAMRVPKSGRIAVRGR